MNGPVQTFVFFDLETTGLINWDAGQGKPMCPDIIEISMVAVHRDCLLWECRSSDMHMPRVSYKLTLPVRTNRVVNSCVASLTGLSNDDLLDAPLLSPTVVKAVAAFLECLPTPMCLIAHNGKRFDFPIFLHHFGGETVMQPLMEHLYCVDSLLLFKELDASGLTESLFEGASNVSLSSQFTAGGSEVQSRNEHTPSRSRKGGRDAVACAPVQVSHIRSVGKPPAQQRLFDDHQYSAMPQNATSSTTTNLGTAISQPAQDCSQDTFSQESTADDTTWLAASRSSSQSSSSSSGSSRGSSRLSYKLSNVHARLFGQLPHASHGAEVDAETMLKCARFYGGRFVRLCEQTAVLLQFATRLQPKKNS